MCFLEGAVPFVEGGRQCLTLKRVEMKAGRRWRLVLGDECKLSRLGPGNLTVALYFADGSATEDHLQQHFSGPLFFAPWA